MSIGEKENISTQGRVIKIVEELEFGVIETEDSDYLFFHISNFDEDIDISEIKEGDLILCEQEVQKSDGRKAAINCEIIEYKGYLKDYFIENALIAPTNIELFDEFCKNTEEYSKYLIKADIPIEDLKTLVDKISKSDTLEEIEDIKEYIYDKKREVVKNKTYLEFLEIIEVLIDNLGLNAEVDKDIDNFKKSLEILISYAQFI